MLIGEQITIAGMCNYFKVNSSPENSNLSAMPETQRWQPKKIEIREIANFSFFDPKKVAPSRDLPIKSRKNSSNIQFFSQNAKNRPKYVSKCILCAFFLLSGTFGDPYRREGDLVCIREIPG